MKKNNEFDDKPYTLSDLSKDLKNQANGGHCIACGKITQDELRDKNGMWIYCCLDNGYACKDKIRDTHL